MKKNLVSGVKPTGRPHIGNYFGAMKQFITLSKDEQYNCYFMIADYHALNLIQNREEMRRDIIPKILDQLKIPRNIEPKSVPKDNQNKSLPEVLLRET
jgi:tryptophanyl-tRNA synthetase